MKKFLIVDGNSIMNRAFYGIRLLTNGEGLYTNAVYGFLNILFKNIDAVNPDYIAVAFDLKAPTFRHKMFDGYKAQRKGMPEELFQQMPLIKEVLSAMNIAILEKEGYEADDIIGTISRMCEEENTECLIITGDKDDLQLASKLTKVYLTVTAKGVTTTEVYDEDKVFEKYGVTPSEFIDVKALMGDTSDNIPGVPGIGEKTALALVAEHKSLDKIYEDVDALKLGPSAKNKLKEGKDLAYLSQKLATIDKFSPIDEKVSDCLKKEEKREELIELFKRLNFKSFINRFGEIKTDKEEKDALLWNGDIKDLLDEKEFYYYIYKTKNNMDAIAFSYKGEVYYSEDVLTFAPIFEADIKKISSGIKEDIVLLKEKGIAYKNYEFDVAIGAYILDPTSSDYKLSRLSMTYLSDILKDVESYKKDENIKADEEKLKVSYKLIKNLIALSDVILKKIKENEQEFLLKSVEMPLIEVLADMEIEGFYVDTAELSKYGKELDIRIKDLQDAIIFMAGEEFNINSPKQLGVILFEKLGLPVIKKTKTGYSTDADVLSQLSEKYEIVESILNYRQLTKLSGTYVEGMLPLIKEDGKIHSTFNQTVTATGRISSTEPNLQNIPVRMEEGRKLRKMFIAGEGRTLVDADYSQIELRVLAHLSGDETMINAYKNGEDIHRNCASRVFGVPESEVTDSMRRKAKAINFGIIYGISEFGLARDMKSTRADAKKYMEAYFLTYPKIKEFMENSVKWAKEDGYAKTLFGRRRYIEELKSSNFNLRSFGERAAMNTPVQGTAADIIKIAMVRVKNALEKETKNSKLILQVHDELIVSAPLEEKELAEKILKREMEEAANLLVPLIADTSSGYSWYDAK